MRKKKLIEISQELFNRLEAAEKTVSELETQNAELKSQVKLLTDENNFLRDNQEKSRPLKELENKMVVNSFLTKDTEYGARIIGQIVVDAARYCNLLTSASGNGDVKELINLILGRTEVAKAEILKTVSAECDFEEKKAYIDAQKSAAEDYFASVMAQLSPQ